jgi:eukaryotic-like serine/threonine-protein kinase
MNTICTASMLGHYRLEGLLGAGSMGVVYLARDLRLDRYVAVKVLTTELDPSGRLRLADEAQTLATLSHPNIATVLDFGSDGPIDFLVMEYVDGAGLDTLLQHAPFDTPRVVSLGNQLAYGLAAAHRAGVIHRDIKPSNLRVNTDGTLKILDFGVATRAPGHSCMATTRTDNATREWLVGTLQYMAPERLRGYAANARTDIFSAGVVLYEMACGRLPFQETHPIRLIELILHAVPVRPSLLNRRVRPALDAVIMRALEKDPRRRYATAGQLGDALEEVGDERQRWVDVAAATRTLARRVQSFWWNSSMNRSNA